MINKGLEPRMKNALKPTWKKNPQQKNRQKDEHCTEEETNSQLSI